MHLLLREYADGNINSVCSQNKGRNCLTYSDMMTDLFFSFIKSNGTAYKTKLPVEFDRTIHFKIRIAEIKNANYQKCTNCPGIFTIMNPATIKTQQNKSDKLHNQVARAIMKIVKAHHYPKDDELFQLLSTDSEMAFFNWLVRSVFAFTKVQGAGRPTAEDWRRLCYLYQKGRNGCAVRSMDNELLNEETYKQEKKFHQTVFDWFEKNICDPIEHSKGKVTLDPVQIRSELHEITDKVMYYAD
jgi:hypothetical protein